ncbi:MAG: hypothetical protein ACFFCY_00740 [Promethearchaeota archaeon]
MKLSLVKSNGASSKRNFPYCETSNLPISNFFKWKSPISISSGITNGIIKFRNFICRESAFPFPFVSTVKMLSFGGKSFFMSTLKADKSYGISYQPSNFS